MRGRDPPNAVGEGASSEGAPLELLGATREGPVGDVMVGG